MGSTFDISAGAPNLLRLESLGITLKFERTSETTGRISWNIPTPAQGCTSETQAYDGMVITIDNTAIDASKLPKDHEIYTSDPTADRQLHAGSKIGTSLVIGAYYGDKTTTYFDISGLKANTPYYVNGFPVDAQYRYFQEGVTAYSLKYGFAPEAPTPAQQSLILSKKDGCTGVRPEDPTGLVCGVNYYFDITFGGVICTTDRTPPPPSTCAERGTTYRIPIDGCKAITYQDLLNEINYQLGAISGCPHNPLPPNAGMYYWKADTQQLFQWDGYTLNELPVIVQDTPPNIPTIGEYWLDTPEGNLYRWNGTTWILVDVLVFPTDPTQPICDETVWSDGTSAWRWNGTAWCEIPLYVSTSDPSQQHPADCGAYWYKESIKQMYKWNDSLDIWITTTVLKSVSDPNALPNGTYWFDTTLMKLFQLNTAGPTWDEQVNVRIQETTPFLPGPGTFWYNPTSEELQQYDGASWVMLDCITYPTDPSTSTSSCSLWWDTSTLPTNTLYVWDPIALAWKSAAPFYVQEEDPTIPAEITQDSVWLNPDTGEMFSYWNFCWVSIPWINYPTDPITTLPVGQVWFDGSVWHEWNGSSWIIFEPIESATDPYALPAGSFWFNTSNNTLNIWNGVVWVNVMYSTSSPVPEKDTCWFNTLTGNVMVWDGTQWIMGIPIGYVELDCNGNLLFTTGATGSNARVVVQTQNQRHQPCPPPTTQELPWVWNSIFEYVRFTDPINGSDGVSGVPMYKEMGIGTDGSQAERLQMMSDIRFQLGYPTVNVELSDEQLDTLITKALEEFRQRSSAAYRRGFFFMPLKANTQIYKLNSETCGFNKIVQVMGVYRMTSAFLSSAHGAGVYGQIVLQQLYNMGTFDLLSYHIIAEYTELMEMLFASRVTFVWNERTREIHFLQKYTFNEPAVLIEATVERTEQDLLTDRWCKPWLRRYTLAQSRITLAEIRGKYSTLPGAGGGVSLNAAELRAAGVEEINLCLKDLDDYVADTPEEHGFGTQFILG